MSSDKPSASAANSSLLLRCRNGNTASQKPSSAACAGADAGEDFASTGAVLDVLSESLGALAKDNAAIEIWRERVVACCGAMGWAVDVVAREHAAGTLLAIAAPYDQLFTATEINEWAWESACAFVANNIFALRPAESSKQFRLPFDRVHPFKAGESAAAAFSSSSDHHLGKGWD